MVVRIEYDRSNRVCIRRTGNRLSHAVDQGANFFCRGQAPDPPLPRSRRRWNLRTAHSASVWHRPQFTLAAHLLCVPAHLICSSTLLTSILTLYWYSITPHSLVPGLNLTIVEIHPTVASPLQD